MFAQFARVSSSKHAKSIANHNIRMRKVTMIQTFTVSGSARNLCSSLCGAFEDFMFVQVVGDKSESSERSVINASHQCECKG